MSKKEYKHEGLLDKSELISLLAIYYDRLASTNQIFTTYITVFLSGIFVVLGGAVIGMTTELDIFVEVVVVCASCIMAMLLCYGLRTMCKRTREHNLESIAKIVIVEEKLGLDNNEIYNSKHWKKDSLVLDTHIESRKGTKTIENFVELNINKGQFGSIRFIVWLIYISSTLIFIIEVTNYCMWGF